MKNKDNIFYRYYRRTTILLGILCTVLLLILFVLLVSNFANDIVSYESAITNSYDVQGAIAKRQYAGDYVASLINVKSIKISIIAVIIAAIGSMLTFAAFMIQKRANEIHRRDIALERLIGNYFKLIDLYRDVVNRIDINGILTGQAAFHFLFYELKSIYVFVTGKYPFLREKKNTDMAVYISMKIYMSGCTDGDNSKLVQGIEQKLGPAIAERIDLNKLMMELEELNKRFLEKRQPPECFIIAKYTDKKLYPELPPLYKGQLQRLSPYFNIIELFLKLAKRSEDCEVSERETVDLYRQMFAGQLTIHEAALLDLYFRYRKFESPSGESYAKEDVALLVRQIEQFPATFDFDNSQYCQHSY